MFRILVLSFTFLYVSGALAHHSVSSLYDYTNVRKLEGTLLSIKWVNPHVQLKIETIGENGEAEVWQLEASAVNLLRRLGVDENAIKTGDTVVATGPVSRRGLKTMVASTLTLADGRTVALFPGSAKRAGLIDAIPTADGSTQRDAAEIAADAAAARGIFRVWTPRKKPTLDEGLGIAQWPLTDAAKVAVAAYNPLFDDPALRCVPAGMPIIMDNPYPMQFYEDGGDIIMHLELSDGLRRIHMNDESGGHAFPPSPLGHSVGHWEDNVLVIHTDKINYPYFDDLGTPQSGDLEIVERYTLSENETRLDWEAVANDPEIFTEPVLLTGYLVWVPGEEVKPFDCTIPEGFSWQLQDE
jgi:hypothetical protein